MADNSPRSTGYICCQGICLTVVHTNPQGKGHALSLVTTLGVRRNAVALETPPS